MPKLIIKSAHIYGAVSVIWKPLRCPPSTLIFLLLEKGTHLSWGNNKMCDAVGLFSIALAGVVNWPMYTVVSLTKNEYE